MIDFTTLQGVTIPEGVVTQITDENGRVIWAVGGDKVILEVEKIVSNTYAGQTLYENEEFILLDIYPKTNGTVNVTYGGLTKTITDTSGAAEPNAQQVFFGTFNGVSDEVETPASGTLTIEGDYYAVGNSAYDTTAKTIITSWGAKITSIRSFGKMTMIPECTFSGGIAGYLNQTTVQIPDAITSIGAKAFTGCDKVEEVIIGKNIEFIGYLAFHRVTTPSFRTVKISASIPPEIGIASDANDDGSVDQFAFDLPDSAEGNLEIIVPAGCGNAYKNAEGWSVYAAIITEET